MVPTRTRRLRSRSDSGTSTSLLSFHFLRYVELSGLRHLLMAQARQSACLPQGGKTDQ
jgi:hypothetical protein